MTTLPPPAAKKLGLVIDLDICVGCHACAVACKEWNDGGDFGPLPDADLYGAHPSGVWFNRVHSYAVEQATPNGTRELTVHFPRSCLHCETPACVTVCPTGASYKRAEDGIVLVDQDRCRGWRMCVSGCPYKKVYFNHKTGKAEKCTFCFPRIEVGLPTVCAETCVGRLRYIGLILYDADRVLEAASVPDDHDLYEAQRSVLLDPNDPEVIAAAERDGIPHDWVQAAQRSPIHAFTYSPQP